MTSQFLFRGDNAKGIEPMSIRPAGWPVPPAAPVTAMQTEESRLQLLPCKVRHFIAAIELWRTREKGKTQGR